MEDLAHQAGLVLSNVGLAAELQQRLDELRASRQRLVQAQDEERRRLERNLHDGAQQYLVAIKVKLGLAQMLAARSPEKAKVTIAQLKADADEALETLRDLARGIYPPLLADKGLVVALESQARKAIVPVSVEAQGVERYAQDVEATVYFCVLEALQNVQKYARATDVTGDPDRRRRGATLPGHRRRCRLRPRHGTQGCRPDQHGVIAWTPSAARWSSRRSSGQGQPSADRSECRRA